MVHNEKIFKKSNVKYRKFQKVQREVIYSPYAVRENEKLQWIVQKL